MRRTVVLPGAVVLISILMASCFAAAGQAAPSALLGDTTVESQVDSNSPGMAEAFPYVAGASGSSATVNVYVDDQSDAATASVGLYADDNGQPGALLASGSLASPVAGGWNSVAMNGVSVVAGDTYWIAVLGEGGTLAFRDAENGGCSSSTSQQTDLGSLPASWTSGGSWSTCSASAYVTGAAGPSAPANTSPPVVSGTAQVGDSLTSSPGVWSNAPTSLAYQWQACDASGQNCSAIAGATSSTYTLTAAQVGDTVESAVTATSASGSATQASSPTAVVIAAQTSGGSTAPTVPTNVAASAVDSNDVSLSWAASTDAGGVAGYHVYRNGVSVGDTTTTTYSDAGLTPGATYAYSLSAYDASGATSARTSPITVIMPAQGSATIFSDNFTGSALSSAWTVISRHGEYAQDETECNVPKQVTVAHNMVDIATIAQSTTCGDFNLDGTVRHDSSAWPYATGDIQWKSLNFTYGTVSYRAKFPPSNTVTWPAVWLLGSNCQATNPMTADVGYGLCPGLETPGYREIDMTECDTNNWCQLALAQPSSFPTCGYPVDGNWHTFKLTWTSTEVAMSEDGKSTGCAFTAADGYDIPSAPMFLIIQTQTGGVGGTPVDANLPAHFDISDVNVTQP